MLTPGALYRYSRQGQAGGHLVLVLIAGMIFLSAVRHYPREYYGERGNR
jgi:hypothetical protein